MGRLDGKVVVVTGSTRGIGRGIALLCGREGARVVIAGRNEEEGRQVVKELADGGYGEAIFIQTDVRKVEECERLIEAAVEQFGRIDGLVNNAGIFPNYTIEETTEEILDEVYAINFKGAFFCTKYAINEMKKVGGGSIVNIGSTHAFGGNEDLTAYACSKGALHTLTRHVSKNQARFQIRANWITVGWVATPGEISLRISQGRDLGWLEQQARERTPMGRLQTEEDIALSAVFLLSDESSQVTGVDLNVTGGFTPY